MAEAKFQFHQSKNRSTATRREWLLTLARPAKVASLTSEDPKKMDALILV